MRNRLLDLIGAGPALVAEVEALPSRCLIASMFDDVYAERPWHLDEQLAELDDEVRRHGEKSVRL